MPDRCGLCITTDRGKHKGNHKCHIFRVRFAIKYVMTVSCLFAG